LRRFPAEFEEFLTAKGRRLLAGSSDLRGALADPRRRFVVADDLIDARQARAAVPLLNRALYEHLQPLAQAIPPESTWDMTADYGETLPKTARLRTAYLEHRRQRAYIRAMEIGLVTMLRSASFGAFAAALAGRPLRRRWGIQVLCYDPGDYAGPHNDHHPEQPAARRGYVDVHVTLCGTGVARQLLVYAVQGHFREVVDVATVGSITAYRLPLWHYTTPLEALPGAAAATARRWVLLGTFLYRSPPVLVRS